MLGPALISIKELEHPSHIS